jgi:CHAD domain-containing protein
MLASSDAEFLHQLRVNQRRLRAALRAYRDVLPSRKRKRLIRDMRKLSPTLGAARDWDVLLARAPVGPGARTAAAAAHAAAREAVQSRKFARTLKRARDLEAKPTDEPLAAFAAQALDRAHRKLIRRSRDIDWNHSRQRHAVRIGVKRLRYTAEFFAAGFPAAGAYIAALKELQSILGSLNDIAVGRRLAGIDGDEAPLLRRLAPAWARFGKRRPFWRAAERKPRRAAR